MKRYSTQIALAGVLILLAGPPAAMAAEGVTLGIVLEKSEYKLADKIEIGFKLKNSGQEPVYVNKRFKLGTPSAAPDQRELFLEVRSSGGDPVELKDLDYETGLPKSEYFELLQPGQEVTSERKWDLKDLAKIEKANTYEVTATYQNAFGNELGLDVFRNKTTARATVQVAE